MSAPQIQPDWPDRLNLIVWCFVLLLLPAVAHAGGLGMAVLATIIAAGGFITNWKKPDFRLIPTWFWAVLVFVFWAWISSNWSPYEDTRNVTNPTKTFIGFIIYSGVFLSVGSLSNRSASRIGKGLLAATGIAVFLLIIDLSTGLALTDRLDPPKTDEEIHLKHIQTVMNLGHSAAILTLFLPVVIWISQSWRNWRKIFGWIYGVLLFGASVVGVFNVGILAVPLIFMTWLFATRFPVSTVKILFLIMIGLILAAPIFGWLIGLVPESLKENLPASWDHRLVMWDFVTARIGEHPLIGHGFDASRTFDATFIGNDNYEMSVVSLHPHNFGLQIWVETGLVGAILAVAALLVIANSILTTVQKNPQIAWPIAGFLVGLMIVGTVSYGVWQEWLWASIIWISSIYQLFSLNLPQSKDQ